MTEQETPRHSRWRRWRARLITTTVVGTLAGAGAVVGVQAASAATVDTTAWYVLINRNSGKALDIREAAAADGAQIQQWARNDGAWQQWQFIDSGGGYYRLRSRHSNKVVDVADFSKADGATVQQWADHNGLNQQFKILDSDGGHVRLVNRNSGKALDVAGYSKADGATVHQWTDGNGTNQHWQLMQLDNGGGGKPAAYPAPMPVSGNTGVHDATVVKRPDGGYLLANTGTNVALKTSSDLKTFRDAGSAFPGGASWTTPYTKGDKNLWAPDLSYRNGKYYLYYSASTFGSNRSAIFLATSVTGASGGWTNQGMVVESQTSDNFNAIDPNLLVDDQGRWWLSFGSFWSGIKMIELDSATGLRKGSAPLSLARRDSNGGAIEAPTLFKHGSYYYLYASFDICCRGAASTYRIMVGRSTSATGPFVDRNGVNMVNGGGTEILAGHGAIHGPGHQAVITHDNSDVLVYHYYPDSGGAQLGLNRIGYDSTGWPYVY
jgi:arabinan endo-1,5-alpha-L-arabinosidase